MLLVSFFFHAEDGIRVLYVTGVQTCALPIYRHRARPGRSRGRRRARRQGVRPPVRARRGRLKIGRASCRERGEIAEGAVRIKKNTLTFEGALVCPTRASI